MAPRPSVDPSSSQEQPLPPAGDAASLPAPSLGLAAEVERLMKMPQSLCKQRGLCCRVATFKGSLSMAEIQAMADAGNEQARDFVSIFIPYDHQEQVRALTPVFLERVRAFAASKGQDPDAITFFQCRYVQDDGRCGVHEDRPLGCRMYPFPHRNTIYHEGCGFEQQGQDNWRRIEEILNALGIADSV